MIVIENLYLSKGKTYLLKGINFKVIKGVPTIITGSDQEGKNLLLDCLARIESIDDGLIIYNAEALPNQERDIEIVQQYSNLFPHKTVMENVIEAPIILGKETRAEAKVLGKEVLRKVGLIHKADMYPESLDRGEKKLVAIAKALAKRPKLLMIDKPAYQLDAEFKKKIYHAISSLVADGLTLVIVTDEFYFSNLPNSNTFILDNGMMTNHNHEDKKDGAH